MNQVLQLCYLPLRLLLVFIFLSACVGPSLPFSEQGGRFPVYFDTRFSYQIFGGRTEGAFPFLEGDVVEVMATLVYHDVNATVTNEILPTAKWFASLYPNGSPISSDVLQVTLRDTEAMQEFTFDWAVDNDDVLLIVSDDPFPLDLLASPKPGDSRNICVSLEVSRYQSPDDSEAQVWMVELSPVGDPVDGLILSEIHACEL